MRPILALVLVGGVQSFLASCAQAPLEEDGSSGSGQLDGIYSDGHFDRQMPTYCPATAGESGVGSGSREAGNAVARFIGKGWLGGSDTPARERADSQLRALYLCAPRRDDAAPHEPSWRGCLVEEGQTSCSSGAEITQVGTRYYSGVIGGKGSWFFAFDRERIAVCGLVYGGDEFEVKRSYRTVHWDALTPQLESGTATGGEVADTEASWCTDLPRQVEEKLRQEIGASKK